VRSLCCHRGNAAGIGSGVFSRSGSAANEFIVGNVSVDLTEPGWNPDDGTALTPNKTVKKDPQVTNTGSNDAFVFLQVKVPTASVKTAAADGSLQDSRKQDLFHYTVNSGWKLHIRFFRIKESTSEVLDKRK